MFKNSNISTFSIRRLFLFTISYISCSSSMATSRYLSSLAFCPPGDTACSHILQIALPASVMLKYLHTALDRFVTPQKAFQRVQFCMHVAGMHVHRLAHVWNAIITTKYYDVMQLDTTSHEYRYRYWYGGSDS